MNPEFWLDRWSRGQIGFHQTNAERYLEEHWAELGLAGGSRVFVPLCGKSHDLLWLRDHGYEVVGIELSEIALEAFCMENGIPARRRALPEFDRYEAPGFALLRGDFFKVPAALLGKVAAVYDRAALISWAPDLRAAYARRLTELTPEGTSILLITLEYPQAQMAGPPFSVESAEISLLFSADYRVKELARRDVLSREPKMRNRGVSKMFDVCYHLARKG